jgi:hypothetical protein
MRVRHVWYAALIAAVPVITVSCAAQANHVRGSFGEETQPPSTAVVAPSYPYPATVQAPPPPVVVQPGQQIIVQPGPSSSVVTPSTVVAPGAQMVQADTLEANEVRAQTIYANRIETQEIQGTIRQTGPVKLDRSVANLRTPTVVASVLYADISKYVGLVKSFERAA